MARKRSASILKERTVNLKKLIYASGWIGFNLLYLIFAEDSFNGFLSAVQQVSILNVVLIAAPTLLGLVNIPYLIIFSIPSSKFLTNLKTSGFEKIWTTLALATAAFLFISIPLGLISLSTSSLLESISFQLSVSFFVLGTAFVFLMIFTTHKANEHRMLHHLNG